MSPPPPSAWPGKFFLEGRPAMTAVFVSQARIPMNDNSGRFSRITTFVNVDTTAIFIHPVVSVGTSA